MSRERRFVYNFGSDVEEIESDHSMYHDDLENGEIEYTSDSSSNLKRKNYTVRGKGKKSGKNTTSNSKRSRQSFEDINDENKNENCSKRKKIARKSLNGQKSLHTTRKGERERQKTDRYGTRESAVNFDNFFTSLAAQNSSFVQSASTQNLDTISGDDHLELCTQNKQIDVEVSKHNSNELSECFKSLENKFLSFERNFDAKIAVFQTQIARVEVNLKHRRRPQENDASFELRIAGERSLSELGELNLPIGEIAELTELEEKLKDSCFALNMVNKIIAEIFQPYKIFIEFFYTV